METVVTHNRLLAVIGVGLAGVSILVATAIYRGYQSDQLFERRQYTAIFDETVRARSIAIGDQLVVALGRYREQHGTWPDDLQDLVPQQVSRLDAPLDGIGAWRYSVSTDRQRFHLSFGVGSAGFPVCYYVPDRGWHLDF